jgi:hypothetical protein
MRTLISLVTLISVSLSAQAPTLDTLLERMAAYLVGYEQQLSSVVADETFSQRVVFTRAYKNGQPVTADDRRKLESEIGFLRLPGGVEWIGFRDVRKINGRPVSDKAQGLAEMMTVTKDVMLQARAIAVASAEHNLGVPRSTNVPTAALEIVHPRNYAAHKFELRGDDTIQRTRVAVIGFKETRRPPLVNNLGGQELISRGRIWVEPRSGTIWRVEWVYEPAVGPQSSLRVEFAMNEALGIMVPTEMKEEFPAQGGLNARGDGTAMYSNFRRFGTGARIVPQQP